MIFIMDTIRAAVKILLWLPIIVGYFLTCTFWKIIIRDPVRQRQLFAQTVSWFCKRVVWFVNAEVVVKNMPPLTQPSLLVSNHTGFFDIIILASVRPCLFITSVEMKNTPVLGALCEVGGCLFVERRSRTSIGREIEKIREGLRQGLNIVLYPEGTSTNGERVLPFKKSLMTAAAGTGVPILPVVTNYTHVDGEPMSSKWRDSVFWYGDQVFFPALWRMMKLKSLRAEMEFLQPIICHNEEERGHIAETAHREIASRFVQIPLEAEEVSDRNTSFV
jgi:1-acyl-sn-glycerol-3-phosphate acyltransferase